MAERRRPTFHPKQGLNLEQHRHENNADTGMLVAWTCSEGPKAHSSIIEGHLLAAAGRGVNPHATAAAIAPASPAPTAAVAPAEAPSAATVTPAEAPAAASEAAAVAPAKPPPAPAAATIAPATAAAAASEAAAITLGAHVDVHRQVAAARLSTVEVPGSVLQWAATTLVTTDMIGLA